MNHVICVTGLCMLMAVVGCSAAGSAKGDEPAAPAAAAGAESKAPAPEVTAEDLAAMAPLVDKAEASIQSRMAGADVAEKRELERQESVVRFARYSLDTAPADIESRQRELQYVRRMLPDQAAGRDYMMEKLGSHAAMIDHPGIEWGGVTTTRFWVHLPDNYASRKDWPVAFFLHGSSRARQMIEDFRSPTAAFPGGKGMPCVGITPKSEIGGGWPPEICNNLLDFVLAHYNVDPDRVSVVGHSRGAGGTLTWAMTSPERIAAIAPTAGSGDLLQAYKIAHIPAWFVHGTADNPGRVGRAIRMVEWLRRLGANPRLTLIPGGGHMDTFQELAKPEFWNWMVSHRRTTPPTGLKPLEFGEGGLTKVEQLDLPARRLLYVEAAAGDALPSQYDVSLETRLVGDAAAAGLECGMFAADLRAGKGVTSGMFIRGDGAAPKGLQMADLPAVHCARVLYKGSPDSLDATCAKLKDRLSADGAKPTGEVVCLYWGTVRGPRPAPGAMPAPRAAAGARPAGGRGRGFGGGDGLYELQFTLEP